MFDDRNRKHKNQREISQALYGRTVWPFSSDDLKKRIEAIIEGFEGAGE